MIDSDPPRPLIAWEDLFKPIVPPRQPDTEMPSREALKHELQRAANLLRAMASFIDAAPFADDAFDNLGEETGRALEAASVALASFRMARDCQGGS